MIPLIAIGLCLLQVTVINFILDFDYGISKSMQIQILQLTLGQMASMDQGCGKTKTCILPKGCTKVQISQLNSFIIFQKMFFSPQIVNIQLPIECWGNTWNLRCTAKRLDQITSMWQSV